MIGRESKRSNNIFFVCSLIEHIGRKTKNHRSVVVNSLGDKKLQHIMDLADIYHSENIDKVSDELINTYKIKTGNFDNIAATIYNIPTIWDIGKVYKRLIISVANKKGKENVIKILREVYNSWITRKIEDFNSSMYYENPDYIYHSYIAGDVLE